VPSQYSGYTRLTLAPGAIYTIANALDNSPALGGWSLVSLATVEVLGFVERSTPVQMRDQAQNELHGISSKASGLHSHITELTDHLKVREEPCHTLSQAPAD
jgi:hypothetical protein